MFGKVSDGIRKSRQFVADVRMELRKSAWPTRSELVESTVVVILTVAVLSLFVGVSDAIIVQMVSLLLR